MRIETTIDGMCEALSKQGPIGLVPTMGNLHAGHIALIHEARRRVGPDGTVAASIFVNRLQFGQGEDFDHYPRTFARDVEQLSAAGCDALFAPDETVIYPEPQVFKVVPDPRLASILEGAVRPGHFEGVCTVVLKLFSIIQPDVAVFGKKDYQQLMLIRRMTAQFALPIRIVGHDTVREPDGLAMSSRNGYLSATERGEAIRLNQVLSNFCSEVRALRSGGRADGSAIARLETAALDKLAAQGWVPDYLTLRRQIDLMPATDADLGADVPLVTLAAARLGTPRLLDNQEV
jgi:pantoate--beta-alanine ligase